VQDFFGGALTAAQVGMYGDSRPPPTPTELAAFYDLLQHYLKSLAANLPPGDVVHSSHHSLQVRPSMHCSYHCINRCCYLLSLFAVAQKHTTLRSEGAEQTTPKLHVFRDGAAAM
jgi:hypothetical protein